MVALQVIGSVNVLGFFPMTFFADAFLTGGVCNVLVFLVCFFLTLGLILSPVLLTLGEAERGPRNREGKD